ncbi:phosphate uptake regulator, PhoU [Geobacter metallireducens RCH3]|uniref:Phosphate-specific transport system accessory protein PhoU n=1 Tax=Geobacter metallireducens (strain ATCC 53774 / DSM 7210 / GS-15) TaxID=269799 RepID=Q39S51_GEOMG|nr:phosphate signaling complex protein PhoU [Geobacter metallireducens]ABB32923.1 phosphate transport system regulatory protein PhoU [Geobacter metallireducens GS-15]EHP88943.1 phosphate uptake regulator, PhoU [Geobacter metallireducens RCH3]
MEREHFSRHFDEELNEIRNKLLEMGGKVEQMISDAMKSLVDRDSDLARRLIATDHQINHLELEIDEKCLQVLARRQPAARDLRFITLALKIVTDLERIGDQCTSVAKRVVELNEEPPLKPYIDLPRMSAAAGTMVKEALDAFVRGDAELAIKVCKEDAFVDGLNDQIQRELLTFMMEDPSSITRAMKLLYISKYMERIADHATNVAEMVIFMVKGKDIRHTAPPSGEIA